MAEQPKPKVIEDDGYEVKTVKNKSRLRDAKAAAKRWRACPKCGNEVSNTTYSTFAEVKPGATPVVQKMMECAVCGERVKLDAASAGG